MATIQQAGAEFVDARTGDVGYDEPLESGTGDAVARSFRWEWVFGAIVPDAR